MSLSRLGKRFIAATVAGGAAAAIICLLVIAWSKRQLSDAQAPGSIHFDAPATEPYVQAFRKPPSTGPTVRVAVIGGMVWTGFWNALADRYQKQTGVFVELIATGPKHDIAEVFKKGGVDVITMHASDTIINLVADGYTMDPQPWMHNDLVIVGPPEDPAGIRGMTDAAAALKKIADAKSPFVVHSSLGAQEVLVNLLEANQIQLNPAHLTILFDDQQRDVLKVAGDQHAYTLVGRIPFYTGRLPNNGLVLMVQGDPRLMRPYLVCVANPKWSTDVHLAEAKRFAAYLRKPETQAWIGGFGKGIIDDHPLFFPVVVSEKNPQ